MSSVELVLSIVILLFMAASYIHGKLVDHKLNILKEQLYDVKRVLNSHVNFESSLHLNTDEVEIIDERKAYDTKDNNERSLPTDQT